MEGMGTNDDHKQFGKRNLTPRSVYTVALYCAVNCFLHRGYVLKYLVEYIVTTC